VRVARGQGPLRICARAIAAGSHALALALPRFDGSGSAVAPAPPSPIIPESHLLAFDEKLKDKSGAKYETSTDGALALALAEPEASKGTLDKIAVGAEIPQVAVYAVPADKATGELEAVFSELISLGTPKAVSVAFTPTAKKMGDGDAPAGSGAKPGASK